ncbi:MAG TPA: helix-turn-helix domain-containing protein [Streptosporangiaceae bacterium]|nr:helix-turn-helix domain-containing protein [Streptosporangiaceae bacterium]
MPEDLAMHENISPGGPMLLTISEAGRELGVSLTTVRRLISSGKLQVVELDTGKSMAPSRRIRRTDLIEFVRGLAVAS